MAVTCGERPGAVSVFFPGKGSPGNEGKDRSCRGFGPSFGQPKRATLLETRMTGLTLTGDGGEILEYCRIASHMCRLGMVLRIVSAYAKTLTFNGFCSAA